MFSRRPSPSAFLLALAAATLPQIASAATIHFSQTSELEAHAAWTLSKPDHTTLKRTDKTLIIPDLPLGHYTLFVEPPEGEITTISVIRNGTFVETGPRPQVSFELADGDEVKVEVTLTLEHFGKVGVNSNPESMAFTLIGPDGLEREGITPAEFNRMPVGNYSVQYLPDGCPDPPGKSAVLKKDGTVYFNLELRCASFVPVETAPEETHVGAEVKGEAVVFTDVPVQSWFAPFVATVSKRGILTGYKDSAGKPTGLFGPGNAVTTGELAKIVHEMADIDEMAFPALPVNPGAVGKWFTKYVASAEQRGWLIYQDPALNLARPATRGEVLMTLLQVLDLPLQWQTGIVFTDVSLRTPHAGAIETAAALGIVSGATDAEGKPTGAFHPEQPITRAEMAKILITIQEKYQKEVRRNE